MTKIKLCPVPNFHGYFASVDGRIWNGRGNIVRPIKPYQIDGKAKVWLYPGMSFSNGKEVDVKDMLESIFNKE
jgi:hypothetical protein